MRRDKLVFHIRKVANPCYETDEETKVGETCNTHEVPEIPSDDEPNEATSGEFFRQRQPKAEWLNRGLKMIEDSKSVLDVAQNVIEMSKKLFKKLMNYRVFKGRQMEFIVAAVVYHGAKCVRAPRSLKEITTLSRTPKREVGKCVNLLNRILSFQCVEVGDNAILQMCNKLNLRSFERSMALEVFKNINKMDLLGGRNPYTVSAVCILLVAKGLIPSLRYETVAEVANITVSTLKITMKELWPLRGKILPDFFLDNESYDWESLH